MAKLMHWATKWGKSHPNVSAVSLAMLPMLAKRIKCVINRVKGWRRALGSAPFKGLFPSQEDRVEHDGLGERHAKNGDGDHFAERAGIASHRFGGLHAHQSYADGRTQTGQADLDAASHFCQHRRYHNYLSLRFCFCVRRPPQLNTVGPPKLLIFSDAPSNVYPHR